MFSIKKMKKNLPSYLGLRGKVYVLAVISGLDNVHNYNIISASNICYQVKNSIILLFFVRYFVTLQHRRERES